MPPPSPHAPPPAAPPDAAALRARFDVPSGLTLGLEEEVMVLHPATGALAPIAADLVADDRRGLLTGELPAAQLELVTPPHASVPEAAAALAGARAHAAALARGRAALASAGVHPAAPAEGVLSAAARYAATRREYGPVARRQLVFGLHVHVAVRPAARALAVYNALRSYLPELAALAANAPFHEGRDTGLASVRPQISGMLPRQGVPPAFGSWEELAGHLRWGHRAGILPTAAQWWWELRLHPALGTLEVRVPDAQTTVGESAAVAAVVHALVAALARRHEAGDDLPVAPDWRIAENRWSASRWGVEGAMHDLDTGRSGPTRERLAALLDTLAPVAATLGCAAELAAARRLVAENGALRQRAVAREGGVAAVVPWLAAAFIRWRPAITATEAGVAGPL